MTSSERSRDSGDQAAAQPGLIRSLRQLGATAMGIAQTRIALAGIELEEEIQRLLKIFGLAFSVVIFAALGLFALTLALGFALSGPQRIWTLAVLGLFYLGLSAVLWWRMQAALAARPPIFEATLAEMERDRAALRGGSESEG